MKGPFWKLVGFAVLALSLTAATSAEPLPASLAGSWRITRILPTTNTTCWTADQARTLIGTTLVYRESAMRWKDGEVPLADITTRNLSAAQFRKENGGADRGASFAQLGIRTGSVLEVNMQHEDMDITGATTEVPGDSVLLVNSNRIVISACGVYFEATRTAGIERAKAANTDRGRSGR
ncbi:MAG TPA: hypothetical protein VGN16_23400 [Acidobacteriaceae bacterium]